MRRKRALIEKLGSDFDYLRVKTEISEIGSKRKEISRDFWIRFQEEDHLMAQVQKIRLDLKTHKKQKKRKQRSVLEDLRNEYRRELGQIRLRMRPKRVVGPIKTTENFRREQLREIKKKMSQKRGKRKKTGKRPSVRGRHFDSIQRRNQQNLISLSNKPKKKSKTTNDSENVESRPKDIVSRSDKVRFKKIPESTVANIQNEREKQYKRTVCQDLFRVFEDEEQKVSANKSTQVKQNHEIQTNAFDFQKLSAEIASNLGKVLSKSLGIVSEQLDLRRCAADSRNPVEKKSEKTVSVEEIMKETINTSGISGGEPKEPDNSGALRRVAHGQQNNVDPPAFQRKEHSFSQKMRSDSEISIQEMPNFQTFQNFYKDPDPVKQPTEVKISNEKESLVKANEIPLMFEALKDAYREQEVEKGKRLQARSNEQSEECRGCRD